MIKLKLTNLNDHFEQNLSCAESATMIEHVTTDDPENSLHAACIQLCGEFPTLLESTLGCLKDFSLNIRFKPETRTAFSWFLFKILLCLVKQKQVSEFVEIIQ